MNDVGAEVHAGLSALGRSGRTDARAPAGSADLSHHASCATTAAVGRVGGEIHASRAAVRQRRLTSRDDRADTGQALLAGGAREVTSSTVSDVGAKIAGGAIPEELAPMVVGFTGYGNVSTGAQEIFDLLPHVQVKPEDLAAGIQQYAGVRDKLIKVVYSEKDLVERIDRSQDFSLEEYYEHPERYRSAFEPNLRMLTVLMNCIYWDKPYPRLVTKELVKRMFSEGESKLKIVGDISCDIDGAIEFTAKATEIDNPTFVYDPIEDNITDGVSGRGIVVMAVDNLPCELPRESSTDFGDGLLKFVPDIAGCDFSRKFADLKLPPPVKKAVILHNGKLTPDYEYLTEFL